MPTTALARAFLALCALLLALLSAPEILAERGEGFDRLNREGRQLLIQAEDIGALSARYDLEILDHHEAPDGGEDLWLVRAPSRAAARFASGRLKAGSDEFPDASISEVTLASLPALSLQNAEAGEQIDEDLTRSGRVWSPCLAAINAAGVWRGYGDQRAARLTRLHLGHYADGYWCGQNVVVAVIDTGIDAAHPLLASALVDGYDFTLDQPGLEATQTPTLDTKTRAIVESGASRVLAGQGMIEVVDSAAIILGDEDSADAVEDIGGRGRYFGHGTMVAGLIRLTAPRARIMPLEAFGSDGVGHPFDIVRAVDYAVAQGAHVINMSFSIDRATPELLAAVERARLLGVMTVAAAGNNGESVSIYPAAYSATIGVAATDSGDRLTEFSNFGLESAAIAAPGSGLVTTFPGGFFASGWGTSFATPLVSGNVALVRSYHPPVGYLAHQNTWLEVLLGGTYLAHLHPTVLSSRRLDSVGAVLLASD
ncbi:MAG: S8 family serine peptidase [Acidobacteriota bacterium]